jgi:ubiquinone/menaquinone biosynthesis C-methylase UbiE
VTTVNKPSKSAVANYWNSHVCETDEYWKAVARTERLSPYSKYTKEYFEAIEENRYLGQADIFAIAQFTRYRGKKVLEIGVGAGTDFLQWVRAGADTFGVDLTEAAIEMTSRRLAQYGLKCCELRVADAENLPFADGFFDLVYSWGVLHHTPDTVRAIEEIIRVTRPGGTIKLMLYNRHSLVGVKYWIQHALLRGKPFQTIAKVLYNHMESPGTKAFTPKEIRNLLSSLPVANLRINAAASTREFGYPRDYAPLRIVKFLIRNLVTVIIGLNKADFFMKIEFDRT